MTIESRKLKAESLLACGRGGTEAKLWLVMIGSKSTLMVLIFTVYFFLRKKMLFTDIDFHGY